MTTQDQTTVGGHLKVLAGWIIGVPFLLAGAGNFVNAITRASVADGATAIGLSAVGALAIPPGIAALRRRGILLGSIARIGAAGIILVVTIAGTIVNSVRSSEPLSPPSPAGHVPFGDVQPLSGTTAEASQIAPKERFTGIAEGDPLRPAQDALNAGRVDDAASIYVRSPVTDERRARPDAKSLHRAIQAASDEIAGIDRSASETDQIATYLRPKLKQISEEQPSSEVELWRAMDEFDQIALALHDAGRKELDAKSVEARSAFIGEVSAKQRRLFPKLRAAYVASRKHALWLEDINIQQRGSTLRLTGAMFAANRNIAGVHDAQLAMLTKFRFQRAEYSWSSADDAPTFYRLNGPTDGVVCIWSGGTCTPVR